MSESRGKAAGINLKVVREPNDGYWSNVWMKKPFVGGYWGGRPTADWMFSQVYSEGADWNESRTGSNEEFNKLLVEARAELDLDKRREMYVEMQRICHNDGGSGDPDVHGLYPCDLEDDRPARQIASNWELDGHKNAERWWMAGLDRRSETQS